MDTSELDALKEKLQRAKSKGKDSKVLKLQAKIADLTAKLTEKPESTKKKRPRSESASAREDESADDTPRKERSTRHKAEPSTDEDEDVAHLTSLNRKRDKILRKLASAREDGLDDRVDELKQRLKGVEKDIRHHHAVVTGVKQKSSSAAAIAEDTEDDALKDAKIAKWQRKYQKATERGNSTRAAKYKAKLEAVGECTKVTEAAAAAGDESMHEKALHRAHHGPEASTDKPEAAAGADTAAAPAAPGPVSLLLFYAYVKPLWTPKERARVVQITHKVLTENGCTGRLRVALEGFNSTLTGPPEGVRAFADFLRKFDPANFGETDFKITDGLAANKAFKGLKVWPVEELVTYGFKASDAPLEFGGTHLKPSEWTEMASDPNAVIIDVRNANETAIGWFQPAEGGAKLLDPRMRRSTEFPGWVDAHMNELKDKKIMMYCTAGIRCERASALLGQKGLKNIFQLEGGIHRYLDAYPEDGGIWVGKNYVFDKRFSHGAAKSEVVGKCACCHGPWERYQAQAKCSVCRMETLLCRPCERSGKAATVRLLCWLCEEAKSQKGAERIAADRAAAAFAATGGRGDGEGEGSAARDAHDDGGGGGFAGKKRGPGGGPRGGGNFAKRPRV